jgi:hypothetical protein
MIFDKQSALRKLSGSNSVGNIFETNTLSSRSNLSVSSDEQSGGGGGGGSNSARAAFMAANRPSSPVRGVASLSNSSSSATNATTTTTATSSSSTTTTTTPTSTSEASPSQLGKKASFLEELQRSESSAKEKRKSDILTDFRSKSHARLDVNKQVRHLVLLLLMLMLLLMLLLFFFFFVVVVVVVVVVGCCCCCCCCRRRRCCFCRCGVFDFQIIPDFAGLWTRAARQEGPRHVRLLRCIETEFGLPEVWLAWVLFYL